MQVALAPEQQDFICRAVESGRFERAEDAVQEAMGLWVERERRRAEILAAVDAAQASIARGEGIEITPAVYAGAGRGREAPGPCPPRGRAPNHAEVMAHRLAPQARAELDDIWDYITRESGNAAVADGVINSITDRFYLLGQYRRLGRARDDLRPGLTQLSRGRVRDLLHRRRSGCGHSPRATRPSRHRRPDRPVRNRTSTGAPEANLPTPSGFLDALEFVW